MRSFCPILCSIAAMTTFMSIVWYCNMPRMLRLPLFCSSLLPCVLHVLLVGIWEAVLAFCWCTRTVATWVFEELSFYLWVLKNWKPVIGVDYLSSGAPVLHVCLMALLLYILPCVSCYSYWNSLLIRVFLPDPVFELNELVLMWSLSLCCRILLVRLVISYRLWKMEASCIWWNMLPWKPGTR